MRYYILKIDSANGMLNDVIANREIEYSFEGDEEIKKGDYMLGYILNPVNQVKMLLEASKDSMNGRLFLKKSLEVGEGCAAEDVDNLQTIIDQLVAKQEDLFEISESVYLCVKNKLLDIVKNMMRDKTLIDLEEEFRGYLVDVRELSGLRQVDELKKWSDALYEDGILDKKVYSIESYDEYSKVEELIRNCQSYKEYKAEKKKQNPQSGLPSDQGLTNYGQFLQYREARQDKVSFINLSTITFTAPKLPAPYNYLVFGAPGTGKSHELKELQEKLFKDDDSYERVTFYSNYSYPNFIGTYKPKMEGKDIVYSYVPGPFVRILEKAYKHPEKNYLLIVEEINRANPAAVFGDVFQLLDRKGGRSEYTIETSEDLKLYFANKFVPSFEEMTQEEKNQVLNRFSKMYIPPNMYIWATMNSADQGVYPMDTAFKRRWDFKYIGIDANAESMEDVVFEDALKRKVNWNKLRMQINGILSGQQCRVNEDKLMGPYFISSEVMAIDKETRKFDADKFDNEAFIDAFKNKVIMYLFEDAAKQRGKEFIFTNCNDISRYSYICKDFDEKGIDIFGTEVVQKVVVGD